MNYENKTITTKQIICAYGVVSTYAYLPTRVLSDECVLTVTEKKDKKKQTMLNAEESKEERKIERQRNKKNENK